MSTSKTSSFLRIVGYLAVFVLGICAGFGLLYYAQSEMSSSVAMASTLELAQQPDLNPAEKLMGACRAVTASPDYVPALVALSQIVSSKTSSESAAVGVIELAVASVRNGADPPYRQMDMDQREQEIARLRNLTNLRPE